MKKLVLEAKEEGKEGKESKIRRGGLPFWEKPIRNRGTIVYPQGNYVHGIIESMYILHLHRL